MNSVQMIHHTLPNSTTAAEQRTQRHWAAPPISMFLMMTNLSASNLPYGKFDGMLYPHL